ncbi:type II toxin-antitoxin system VapC family toxin [Euzebya tangerina]|uniref:type II toxin-antitoxin system VapC family toxin n=1 Tax=Euzebya tangerina TaxID=591198 RepID=UPI000E31CA39|nr:hypothetical protein [Euzebya tangerina]
MSAVYVVDAGAAVALARQWHDVDGDRFELFAPTLLRSQVLALLRREAATQGGDPATLLELAQSACRLPRRLLGDAVLRQTAWNLALSNEWESTYDAEYIALTQLHGTALVATDPDLRARAEGLVDVCSVADLIAP